MDYAEMVSQIMAAEQGAKVLAEESRARRQQLQAGLEQEISLCARAIWRGPGSGWSRCSRLKRRRRGGAGPAGPKAGADHARGGGVL